MADTMSHLSNGAHHSSKDGESGSQTGLESNRISGHSGHDFAGKYVAVSPKGIHLPIPKELFTALSDFIATRKCPGSITIQFRGGEILCVESVAKKTYRNNA
jgi:hypothetical protein